MIVTDGAAARQLTEFLPLPMGPTLPFLGAGKFRRVLTEKSTHSSHEPPLHLLQGFAK
jgi:hypothetical protein